MSALGTWWRELTPVEQDQALLVARRRRRHPLGAVAGLHVELVGERVGSALEPFGAVALVLFTAVVIVAMVIVLGFAVSKG